MYQKLVTINDLCAKQAMERQVLESDSRFYGGVADPVNGIPWPSHGGTAMILATWAAALINEDSQFYHDKELLRRLELGTAFMLRFQHADGTISPGWTNMHSPPDTAFVVGGLAQVYMLMSEHAWEPLGAATEQIRQFLERTVPALLTGGCHTPNHRWVITAALGFMYNLTGRPELKERANAWLAEGLDCTEDGEWTERSNGIYNAVSDIVLYYTAEQLDRPELLEPVRRNLRMMGYMLHPDGEVVTDYSGRQDFGTRFDMGNYFLILKLMAAHDKDPLFEALAEVAAEALSHPGGLPNHAMIGLLRYKALRGQAVEPAKLPEQYRVIINGGFAREQYLSRMEAAGHGGRIYHSRLHPDFGAPVARQRDGATSVTVMTETSSFFALRHGAAKLLGVQLGTSFEPGFVRMSSLQQLDDGYRLTATEKKGYYGPVSAEHLPESASGEVSPWYLLPHHLREMTHEQRHDVEVEITEIGEGWRIRVHCERPEVLLTQISFVFSREGELTGDDLEPAAAGTWFWKSGKARLTAGEEWLELSAGAHEHLARVLNNMSYSPDCQTLIVNLMTPYDTTFDIRLSKQHITEGEAGR